jgi:signal transduction histidine kinase
MRPSITNRLRLGFGLLVVLLGVVSVLGVGRLFQVREDFEDTNARYFRLELQAERIRSAFVLEQAALSGLQAQTPKQRAKTFARARTADLAAIEGAEELSADDADVMELLAARRRAEDAWRQRVAKPVLARHPPPAGVQRRLTRRVAQTGAALITGIQNARESRRQTAQDETRDVAILVAVGLLGALLAALVLFTGLVSSMRAPLARLVEGARRLAGGDLSTRVEAGGPAEIATLGQAFNEMATSLERDARERERVERMKDDFLLTVSHELRTPVTSVKGFAEMLAGQENSLNADQREAVEAISESAGGLSALIDDLLDLARSDAGRLRIKPKPTAVRPLLDRLARQMRPAFASRDQKLKVTTPKALPRVKADPERVAQVLTNLLGNANKYAPPKSTVRLSAEQNGRAVAIAVTDAGHGMSEEQRQHVFERFWRADSSSNQRVGGTGLGLAIARSLVELHGGEISVASSAEEGTSFRFTLPVTKAKARARARARASGKRKAKGRS